MIFDYIIVQAGGKGSRLGQLTRNKPKAIVPVNNLPMLFHLFQKYPDKSYIIIADYKADVLERYLHIFAKVKYLVINAGGNSGTCAGINDALFFLPKKKPFMLIWSDLVLDNEFEIPDETENYIGLSEEFVCRWSYKNRMLAEIASKENGVAGFFLFKEKTILSKLPENGEFVKWLKDENIDMIPIHLKGTKEYGSFDAYQRTDGIPCRPFNRIFIDGNKVIKQAVDHQGKELEEREKNWYKKMKELGVKNIPEIYSFEPFTMQKIEGKHVFEYEFSKQEKQKILQKIIKSLREIHASDTKQEINYFSVYEAYINKTLNRLEKIRSLVPFANEKYIEINGKICKNIFFYKNDFKNKFYRILPKCFCPLHGDATFSNIILQNGEPFFIDPRGYFGFDKIYGDPIYDWAKLYYSVAGNYDQFNQKNFQLEIRDKEVLLTVDSNNWEDTEDYFFSLLEETDIKEKVKLIHAIIWLSLTTYAWEDYDSICGAFYNGIYYLEDIK